MEGKICYAVEKKRNSAKKNEKYGANIEIMYIYLLHKKNVVFGCTI